MCIRDRHECPLEGQKRAALGGAQIETRIARTGVGLSLIHIFNYNGSLVGSDPDDYSAARLLARIHNSQYGNIRCV